MTSKKQPRAEGFLAFRVAHPGVEDARRGWIYLVQMSPVAHMSVVIFFRGSKLGEVNRVELDTVVRRAIEGATGFALTADQEAHIEKNGYYTVTANFDWELPEPTVAQGLDDPFTTPEIDRVGAALNAGLQSFSDSFLRPSIVPFRQEFFWELSVQCLKKES